MDDSLMSAFGTIFDEKPDTSVIEELRFLYARVKELEEKLDLSQKENCELRRKQEDFDQCELQLAEAITDAEDQISKLENLDGGMTFIQRLGLMFVLISLPYMTSHTPASIVAILAITIGGAMFLYEKPIDK